jgi:hypothetical protein
MDLIVVIQQMQHLLLTGKDQDQLHLSYAT